MVTKGPSILRLAMRTLLLVSLMALSATALAQAPRVKVEGGWIEGAQSEGVRMFFGVPYAQPPVGDLRWKAPQPAKPWTGTRDAKSFASRPMQLPIFSDMIFRSPGVSEDCLYLNVWAPPAPKGKRMPVLVYFYGGGFVAGDSSEPRYDGQSLASRGIVAITVNYRLGVFGFMAHPELTKESPHHASGNYGLLDQSAALEWVKKNVAAFGGDPKRVTIAGESAGSFSVSAQMASPRSRGLIAGAIGESGAALSATPLATAEQNGERFATSLGAKDLAALRAIPAQQLLDATKGNAFRFGVTVDGYFLPKPGLDIYTAGQQAHVPLLAGWNAAEGSASAVLGNQPPTQANFEAGLRRLYKEHADEALSVFPHATDEEIVRSATEIGSDQFIGYGTWKWTDLHGKTGDSPVYRYYFTQPRPGEPGAFHSVEIEYALGNLDRNPRYAWTDVDRRISETMESYFANFIKTGDPNGLGLAGWPTVNREGYVMRIGPDSRAERDTTARRYRFYESARPAGR